MDLKDCLVIARRIKRDSEEGREVGVDALALAEAILALEKRILGEAPHG